MHHFNLKSLTLYGTMIGGVFLLFKLVSAYGENQLKAPPKISGNYLIQLKNPPKCLEQKDLMLTIEQSGIYLFAALFPGESNPKTIKSQLNGNLSNQQFILSGTPDQALNCSPSFLQINGTLNKQTLLGQIQGKALPNPVLFQGSLKAYSKSNKSPH